MCSLCSSFSSWQKGACYKLPLQLWSNLKSHVTTENYLLTVLLYTETHTQTPFLLSFYDSDFLKIPRKLTSKMVLYFECMYLIFHWSHLSWFTIPVLYPVFSKNGFKFNVGLNKLKLIFLRTTSWLVRIRNYITAGLQKIIRSPWFSDAIRSFPYKWSISPAGMTPSIPPIYTFHPRILHFWVFPKTIISWFEYNLNASAKDLCVESLVLVWQY